MTTLPSLFVSHGAPTFALDPGRAGAGLARLGRALPRPEAVLVISAHWQTPEPMVTVARWPTTLHDFAGFGPALQQMHYPAPGHPRLAERTLERLREAGWSAHADSGRGLDHGAWVPLLHLYPDADVPVFQLSLPTGLDGAGALAFGRALAPLADEGVLITGSGSLTHNLADVRNPDTDPGYALEFARWIREAVQAGDHDRIAGALQLAPHARRAHPTAEHFLPLPVAVGAVARSRPVTVLDGGLSWGVLVMDAFVFGCGDPSSPATDRGFGA